MVSVRFLVWLTVALAKLKMGSAILKKCIVIIFKESTRHYLDVFFFKSSKFLPVKIQLSWPKKPSKKCKVQGFRKICNYQFEKGLLSFTYAFKNILQMRLPDILALQKSTNSSLADVNHQPRPQRIFSL